MLTLHLQSNNSMYDPFLDLICTANHKENLIKVTASSHMSGIHEYQEDWTEQCCKRG